jgi:peptidoglycan/LPS O-acetylase OafA/YrhL
VFVAILLPWLLKEPLIYYPFLARFPVIICGVMAYVYRENLEYLVKFFAFAMLLTLTTKENMVIHSMMIPLLFAALSVVELKQKPLERVLSFCGSHSLEIFFAQTITTQFMMQRYFWIDKWLSLLIIVGLTIAISFLFWGVQKIFDVINGNIFVIRDKSK